MDVPIPVDILEKRALRDALMTRLAQPEEMRRAKQLAKRGKLTLASLNAPWKTSGPPGAPGDIHTQYQSRLKMGTSLQSFRSAAIL